MSILKFVARELRVKNAKGARLWKVQSLRQLLKLLSVLALLVAPVVCLAAVPECQTRVLQPVTDDMGRTWQPGAVVPVDIVRKGTHGVQLCAHGGACLPRRGTSGQLALQLMNCKAGPSIGGGDYRLVPDARLAGDTAAAAMKARADAERKLSSLGFSNAAAGSLAENYIDHPHTAQSTQVRRALAGSTDALKALQARFP